MSALVLDAGALLAIDRNDRDVVAYLKMVRTSGMEFRTTGVVVAEVWRDPNGRQANLARFLKAVDIKAVDGALGREAGVLLGMAGTNDPADATIAAVANTGDEIMTSDPHDIGQLISVSGRLVTIVRC
jgi:predicted nucleic acid-binding protein